MPRRPARRPSSLTSRAKKPSHTTVDAANGGQRVSSEEKRQLILAHAAARRHLSWGPGYYVAIAASCLVIASGWWLTLDKNLRAGIHPGGDGLIQTVKNSARVFDADTPQNDTQLELQREALEATAASIQALSPTSTPSYSGSLPTAHTKR